jgi:hypothetical protein
MSDRRGVEGRVRTIESIGIETAATAIQHGQPALFVMRAALRFQRRSTG